MMKHGTFCDVDFDFIKTRGGGSLLSLHWISSFVETSTVVGDGSADCSTGKDPTGMAPYESS